MRPTRLNPASLALAVSLATSGTLALLPVHATLAAEARLGFDIASGPLEQTLRQIARQSGRVIAADPALLQGKRSAAVRVDFNAEEAVRQALSGTNLQLLVTDNGTLTVQVVETGSALQLGATSISTSRLGATTEGTGSYTTGATSTATKMNLSIRETPQSITVMTRQQMDDQRLDTLTDVLRNTPGIYLWKRPYGGNDIFSRGFATDTLQYDGVPLRRYQSFGNDTSVSAVYLDRVEVMRGAQGLLEGGGKPSGSINLIRKRGLADSTYTLEGRAGSWDNYGTRVDVGGPLNEEKTLRSRVVVDYEDKHSYLDYVWDRNLNTYAALDFDITPDTTVGLGVAYARLKGNSSLYDGVPRYENGKSISLPRSTYAGAAWNEATRRETQVFFDIEQRLNANWSWKLAAVHVQDEWGAVTSYANELVPVGGTTVQWFDYKYDNSSKSSGLDINLKGNFQALGLNHDLVVGGNYSKNTRDDEYVGSFFIRDRYDVFKGNPHAPAFGTYPTTIVADDVKADIKQKGLYAVINSHLTDRLTTILGSRVSWYDYEAGGIYTNWNDRFGSRMKENGEVTPYAGIVYDLSPDWSLYASYADIFTPQSATNAQRQVLKPMTGIAYETGIKGELFDGALNTSIALFRVEQENRAVTDYDSPKICGGGGTSFCSRSAGKVKTEGFELEAHGELVPGLQISGGYTYNRNETLEDTKAENVGKPFDYLMPRHMLRLWSSYQLPSDLSKWKIGLGATYQSEQKTSSDTQLNPVQGGYTIWSGMISYQIDKNWSTSLNIDNVFDKHYYSSISDDYYYSYAGEPRKLLISTRYQF